MPVKGILSEATVRVEPEPRHVLSLLRRGVAKGGRVDPYPVIGCLEREVLVNALQLLYKIGIGNGAAA